MNVQKRGIRIVILLVAGTASFGIGMAATADRYPPAPPWVRLDGTVDRAKLPACIVALDQDGQAMRDRRGKQVCVPSADLFAPPVAPPGQAEPNSATVLRRYTDATGREILQAEPQRWPFDHS